MAEGDPRCWGCYQMRNRTCLPQCPFAPVFPPPTLPQDGAAFSRYISRYQPIHMGDALVRIDDLETKHMYIDMLDFEISSSLTEMEGGTLEIVSNLHDHIEVLNQQIAQLQNQVNGLQNQIQNQNQTVQVLTNARDAFLTHVEEMEDYREDLDEEMHRLTVMEGSINFTQQDAQDSAQALTDFIAALNNQQ